MEVQSNSIIPHPAMACHSKQILFTLALLLFTIIAALGQSEKHQRILFTGTSSGGFILRANPPLTTHAYRFNYLNFQPRIGFFVTDELLIAGQAMVAYSWATDQALHSHYGWGVLSRYYPRWASQFIQDWAGKELENIFYLHPFIEGGYHRASYYQAPQGTTSGASGGSSVVAVNYHTTDTPSIDEFQLATGINWRVYRAIHLEISLVYAYRPDPRYPVPAVLQPRIGIDLLINRRNHD